MVYDADGWGHPPHQFTIRRMFWLINTSHGSESRKLAEPISQPGTADGHISACTNFLKNALAEVHWSATNEMRIIDRAGPTMYVSSFTAKGFVAELQYAVMLAGNSLCSALWQEIIL